MTRVTQVILARRTLAVKLAHESWTQEPSRSTLVPLLRTTAALCREVAGTLHQLAVHNRSDMVRYSEELVTSTELLSVMADTSFDPEAVAVFERHHRLSLPGSFRNLENPLTPANLSVDVSNALALLDSYCERMKIDQSPAFGVLKSFCDLAEELSAELYRLDQSHQAGEVAVVARTVLRNCFKYS